MNAALTFLGKYRRPAVRRPVFERLEDRSLLALVIDPGAVVLLPDAAGQAIPIHVSSTAPASDPQVTGFNLRAQLGDGLGPGAEPVFQAIQFGGGIWDAFPVTTVGGPVSGNQQLAQASVLFNASGQSVPAQGLVVTLIISTVGISSGEYELRLAGTDIGSNSEFIGFQGASIPASISVGTIQIAAPPWQNPANRLDVNADTRVTPLDALIVINEINIRGGGPLPVPPQPPTEPPPYLDVNGDNSCTPLDVLLVVNWLNERSAELFPQSLAASSAAAEGEAYSVAAAGEVPLPPESNHRERPLPVWPAVGSPAASTGPLTGSPAASAGPLTGIEAADLLFSSDLAGELGLPPFS